MPLFDIGVNLTSPRLADQLDDVLIRARQVGVSGGLITGTDITQSQTAVQIAQRYPGELFATAGIHPHYAIDADNDFIQQLKTLAECSQVKAIGECGLDFNRNFSPRDVQLSVFEAQLELACELKLPVFLHERDAFEQQINLIKKYRSQLVGGVAHCFTGNRAQMEQYLQLDLYIGITGWLCDDKRGKDLQAAVKHLPLERLLLETDAPYLAPKTLKPKVSTNEPCYLPEIARYFAEISQQPLASVVELSYANAHTLFAINL
ncbi:TatD family hydrolase [Neptunicella sp. SCSIO 80796]|uniref:TatD family hydrolase n=1 Tax=Neptunicella plasticusilytica TaxID=3117012 RepID=UPI003A4E1394